MTVEKLMDKFVAAEVVWKACRELARLLRESMTQLDCKVESCVCFGTGPMCGYDLKAEWENPFRHEIALHQFAEAKEGVNDVF